MSFEASGDRNIDRRMEEVNGKPQRVEPIDENDLTPEVHEICRRARAAMKIPEDGVMPEVMRTMLAHPDLFQLQMAVGVGLALGKIPARERELAVLRVGWLCGAPYEWGEHVVISKRLGVTDAQVEAATKGSKDGIWDEHDRAILKGVEELFDSHILSDETWATLAKTWDEQQLMEFPFLVGQYVATAFYQNSLRCRLAHNNPGLGLR